MLVFIKENESHDDAIHRFQVKGKCLCEGGDMPETAQHTFKSENGTGPT